MTERKDEEEIEEVKRGKRGRETVGHARRPAGAASRSGGMEGNKAEKENKQWFP